MGAEIRKSQSFLSAPDTSNLAGEIFADRRHANDHLRRLRARSTRHSTSGVRMAPVNRSSADITR
jgi:hypothetical protein